VRVETRSGDYPYTALLERKVVSVDPTFGPVADYTAPSNTCRPDSPIGVLQQAVGAAQVTFVNDGADPTKAKITKLLGVGLTTPPATPPSWEVSVAGVQSYGAGRTAGDPCRSIDADLANTEVLVYLKCNPAAGTNLAGGCFNGVPLLLRTLNDGFWPLAPFTASQSVPVYVFRAPGGPSTTAVLSIDRGSQQIQTDQKFQDGSARIDLPDVPGPHTIIAQNTSGGVIDVPDRIPICVTDGKDGFCGTTKSDIVPFNVQDFPAACDTNGHDGFCGTQDTSGPVVHVTNIKDKQVFKRRKGPGQVRGTLAQDPNGVGRVRFRLSRQLKTKVLVKASRKSRKKKARKRYRTVTRCTVWNGDTLNIETAKCAKRTTAKWFEMDLSDLRNEFSYSFALTLPRGSYVLEVEATDENGFKDAPAPGRNVLRFTVS
jgi:hypothetical protein